jgi:hypothetical protein
MADNIVQTPKDAYNYLNHFNYNISSWAMSYGDEFCRLEAEIDLTEKEMKKIGDHYRTLALIIASRDHPIEYARVILETTKYIYLEADWSDGFSITVTDYMKGDDEVNVNYGDPIPFIKGLMKLTVLDNILNDYIIPNRNFENA